MIVIGVTVGVYLAVAVLRYSSRTVPSLSLPTGAVNDTVIPFAVPVNPGSGTKVTSPVASLIEYVPSPATVTEVALVTCPVAGSTNLAGYSKLGVTEIFSPLALVVVVLKVGVPV